MVFDALAAWYADVRYHPLDSSYPGPRPLPPDAVKAFDYEPRPLEARLGLDEGTKGNPDYTRYFGGLELLDGSERNIPIAYYETKRVRGRAPLFIVSPAISERFERFYERVCGIFAKGGVSCLALKNHANFLQPTHGAAELQDFLVNSVTDARRAVDWAVQEAKKPASRIDPDRFGSFGISLGGIKNLTWLATDHRPRANVIVMAAGGIADVLATSTDADVRTYWKDRKECLGCTDDALKAELASGMAYDPLALAPHVNARHMLYIMSTKDDVVPSALQRATYEALGKPEAYSLATGHDTSGVKLILGYMSKRISRFVRDKLDMR